jgi:hypothetical protein
MLRVFRPGGPVICEQALAVPSYGPRLMLRDLMLAPLQVRPWPMKFVKYPAWDGKDAAPPTEDPDL